MKQEQPPVIVDLIKEGREDGSLFLSSHDS